MIFRPQRTFSFTERTIEAVLHRGMVVVALFAACGGDGGGYAWDHRAAGDWVVGFDTSPCGGLEQVAFNAEPTFAYNFDTEQEDRPVVEVTFDATWLNCEVLGDESTTPYDLYFRCCLDEGATCSDLEMRVSDDGTYAQATVDVWTNPADRTCVTADKPGDILDRVR